MCGHTHPTVTVDLHHSGYLYVVYLCSSLITAPQTFGDYTVCTSVTTMWDSDADEGCKVHVTALQAASPWRAHGLPPAHSMLAVCCSCSTRALAHTQITQPGAEAC